MNLPLPEPLYNQSLVIDLYELTMSAGYFSNNYNHYSTFELFIREMPRNRSYLVNAGLEQAIEYLINLKFTDKDIDYLRSLKVFQQVNTKFWEYLENFKFSGDVWGIPEGQIVFPGEPLLRVSAPIIEAQIVETFLLATYNFQTLIASKAARVVQAAQLDGKKRSVMEFGSRRAHGPQASVLAGRASFIAGCIGTSNVLAGQLFNIPVFGTAAHSWTMAFPSEIEAFKSYYQVFPESTILLIDTYNIENGARNAVETGNGIRGVRIDSGDLAVESRNVRKILDDAGMKDVVIVVSGDLNEYKIRKLVEAGAPIDSFGVGTQLATSEDAPSLGGIYKLVEQKIDSKIRYRAKFSINKATYPGKKQVYRLLDDSGKFIKDIIGLENDQISEKHVELLIPIFQKGRLIYHSPSLEEIRNYFQENFKSLDQKYTSFEQPQTYPVSYSPNLTALFNRLKEESNHHL
jgi:nicotinate phosphoribosyltransferase